MSDHPAQAQGDGIPGNTRTATKRPLIAVIIPVLNKRSFLNACLESVVQAAGTDVADVVVVDNGSTDGSRQIASGYSNRLRVLDASGTIAAVRNHGAEVTEAPIVSFLDCDIVVPPDYFDRLLRVFDDASIAATGYPVGLPADAKWLERTWHHLHRLRPGARPNYINSGNFAVRREAFDSVGGFDARLRTGEDTDICKRLRAAGFAVVPDASLEVAHLDNPKTISAFFRKQVWHGQGMGQGRPLRTPCRVTMATSLYVLLTFAGLSLGVLGGVSFPTVAAFFGLHLAVPAISVAVRLRRSGRYTNPVLGIALYDIYFAARTVALFQLLAKATRGPRDPSAGGVAIAQIRSDGLPRSSAEPVPADPSRRT